MIPLRPSSPSIYERVGEAEVVELALRTIRNMISEAERDESLEIRADERGDHFAVHVYTADTAVFDRIVKSHFEIGDAIKETGIPVLIYARSYRTLGDLKRPVPPKD